MSEAASEGIVSVGCWGFERGVERPGVSKLVYWEKENQIGL